MNEKKNPKTFNLTHNPNVFTFIWELLMKHYSSSSNSKSAGLILKCGNCKKEKIVKKTTRETQSNSAVQLIH